MIWGTCFNNFSIEIKSIMKPLKSGLSLVNWIFRISLLLFVIISFYGGLKSFDFLSKGFYISSIFIVTTVLLFMGGVLSKPSITIISGLILSLVSFVLIFFNSFKLDLEIANYLIILAIGFYFLCTGNWKSYNFRHRVWYVLGRT